jgi:hypothetical protein
VNFVLTALHDGVKATLIIIIIIIIITKFTKQQHGH